MLVKKHDKNKENIHHYVCDVYRKIEHVMEPVMMFNFTSEKTEYEMNVLITEALKSLAQSFTNCSDSDLTCSCKVYDNYVRKTTHWSSYGTREEYLYVSNIRKIN